MDLAAFELRGVLRGTDDFSLSSAELVDHARDQRNLRTDDGEIGIDGIGRSQVIRGRQKLAELGDPGIARRAGDLVTLLCQAPGDGVFAAAAANDENFHETRIFTRRTMPEMPVYRGTLECS